MNSNKRIGILILTLFYCYLTNGQASFLKIDSLTLQVELPSTPRSCFFSAGNTRLAIVQNMELTLYSRSGKVLLFRDLSESISAIKQIKFDKGDTLVVIDSSETTILKIYLDIKKYKCDRPEDYYLALDEGIYSNFFHSVTWFPALKYNQWKKQDRSTRFDYELNLYATPNNEIYMVLPSLLCRVFHDGFPVFNKSNIWISSKLNIQQKILHVDDKYFYYSDNRTIYRENLNTGELLEKNLYSPVSQKVYIDSNTLGEVYTMEISDKKLVIKKWSF